MSDLICEYPEDGRLDLQAMVIKSKHIDRQQRILDIRFPVPDDEVGGKITAIEHIMAKVLEKRADILNNSVKDFIHHKIIMTVAVGSQLQSATREFRVVASEFQVVTIEDIYEKRIPLEDFDPPLDQQDLASEVQEAELTLLNWNFDAEILGNSEDESNPCNLTSPISGTCLSLKVYADIINTLGKSHSIIVYGELDPDIELGSPL